MIDNLEIEERNQQRLAGWWALLGAEPEYPVPTSRVLELLTAVEYAIDNDLVLKAITDGWFMPPQRENSRYAWTATDIAALAAALEGRRLWRPFSQIHGHKRTHVEKLQELLNERGEQTFADLGKFDFAGLLGLLVKVSHDPGAVQVLALAIKTKLESKGININE